MSLTSRVTSVMFVVALTASLGVGWVAVDTNRNDSYRVIESELATLVRVGHAHPLQALNNVLATADLNGYDVTLDVITPGLSLTQVTTGFRPYSTIPSTRDVKQARREPLIQGSFIVRAVDVGDKSTLVMAISTWSADNTTRHLAERLLEKIGRAHV